MLSCLDSLATRTARAMPAVRLHHPDAANLSASAATARMRVRTEALDSDAAPLQVPPRLTAGTGITPNPQSQDPAWIWIITLCTIAILICYADRTNISFAIVSMSSELGWTESYKGTILSVFFIGYAGTQLWGGALADRLGGKSVLAAGMVAVVKCACYAPIPMLPTCVSLCRSNRLVSLHVPDT